MLQKITLAAKGTAASAHSVITAAESIAAAEGIEFSKQW